MNNLKTRMISRLGVAFIFCMFMGLNAYAYDEATTRDVQKALSQKGYNPGPANGIFSKETEEAVRAFQRDNGLNVNGELYKNVVEALGVTWDRWRTVEGTVADVKFSRTYGVEIQNLGSPNANLTGGSWDVDIFLAGDPLRKYNISLNKLLDQSDFKPLIGKPGSDLIQLLKGRDVVLTHHVHSRAFSTDKIKGKIEYYDIRDLRIKK